MLDSSSAASADFEGSNSDQKRIKLEDHPSTGGVMPPGKVRSWVGLQLLTTLRAEGTMCLRSFIDGENHSYFGL